MNMKNLSLLAAVACLSLTACSKNPADNVPAADVKSAAPAPAAAAVAKTYAFGPETSKVGFVGSKVTGSHAGGFAKFAGELNVVDGKVAAAGSKVVIEVASLFSDAEKLTGHLKGPDFFDAAKFPTATFTATAIEHGATNSVVTGNLSLHGVTKQISFPATIHVSDSAVSLAAEFSINRFDFEIKYPGKTDDLIRQEVVLKLKVEAKPGKATFPTAG